MKETKRRAESFMFFDYAGVERHLAKMAAKGWRLESTANWAWTYRRCEPAQVTYAVTYAPDASDWNPQPTRSERELEAYCAAAGWQKVCDWGKAQIYCTEQPNSVPIETDEAMRLEIIRKSMRKGVLPSYFLLLAVFAFNIWAQWGGFKLDPVEFLSGNRLALMALIFWGIFIDLWGLVYYLWWSRRSEKSVREGDGCVRPRCYRVVERICWAGLVLIFLWLLWGQGKGYITFMLLYTVGMLLVGVVLFKTRAVLKNRGVSKKANWTVFLVLDIVLVCALMGGMVWGALKFDFFSHQPAEVYTDERGMDWDIYHDDLPLRAEDFVAVDEGVVYSCRAERQESLLLAMDTYTQRSFHFNKDLNAPELGYDVLEVKAGFLYDECLHYWLEKYLEEDERLQEYNRVYYPEDAALWGADAAYRLYYSRNNEPINNWVLCKGDDIVRIHTDWDMTGEMKPLVLEQLLAE